MLVDEDVAQGEALHSAGGRVLDKATKCAVLRGCDWDMVVVQRCHHNSVVGTVSV